MIFSDIGYIKVCIDRVEKNLNQLNERDRKIDKILTSTLDGTGIIYAKKSIEYGVDPYLAVAISMHETGCKWTCSKLARN